MKHETFDLAEIEGMGLTPGQFAALSHGKTHYILLGPEDGPLVVLFHVSSSNVFGKATHSELARPCVSLQGFGVFSFIFEHLFEPLIS
jgi:hypothetical protein